MSLPIPNLDNRNFEQLFNEARALIPKNFPAWTDHNPSDPGMTLLEVFAFFMEIAIFQLNRIPERSLEHFSELVGESRQVDAVTGEPEAIEKTLRRAQESLETRQRAVTEQEFEALAKQAAPEEIARANALIEVVDTLNVFPDEQFVKVIIIPDEPANQAPLPSDALRQTVFEFLRSRRLITTRVQVIAPEYTEIDIAMTIVRDISSRLDRDVVQQSLERTIGDFLSPLNGGVDGAGWEFGRSIFRSELYQLIEGIAGVDHAKQLLLNGSETVNEEPLISATSLVSLQELLVTVVDE